MSIFGIGACNKQGTKNHIRTYKGGFTDTFVFELLSITKSLDLNRINSYVHSSNNFDLIEFIRFSSTLTCFICP